MDRGTIWLTPLSITHTVGCRFDSKFLRVNCNVHFGSISTDQAGYACPVHVRSGPKATYIGRCRGMTKWANRRHLGSAVAVQCAASERSSVRALAPRCPAPEARKAYGGAEFLGFCLLQARDYARALETGFCLRALPRISSISQIIAGSDIARGWDATAISSSANCSGNSKTLRR
jgi:hypothetical protein